jgi:glycosidase
MSRIFLSLGKDVKKLKMALALLLTTRGIPELYYGTELLMDGDGGYHPNVRKDFPGGWSGDKSNAFTAEGRTEEQNDLYNYLKKILDWRKDQPAIHTGKLTHYIPEDNIYVYFRYNPEKTIMVILNANTDQKKINTARFNVHIKSSNAINVLSGERLSNITAVTLQPWEAVILEIR